MKGCEDCKDSVSGMKAIWVLTRAISTSAVLKK